VDEAELFDPKSVVAQQLLGPIADQVKKAAEKPLT
jgi:hypothetical protein